MNHGQLREVIASLLNRRKEWFTTGELARAANISRQAALKHVKRMVQSSELESFGARANRHYGAGPGWDDGHGAVWRGRTRTRFWEKLGERVPDLAYLDAGASIGPVISRRSQIRELAQDLRRFKWVIVDFWCVERISDAAAHELFVNIVHETGVFNLEAINMAAEVAAVVHRVILVDGR